MTNPYKPAGLAIHILEDIPALFTHPSTRKISQAFAGKKFMCKLPGGQLYFDSKLALDTDGSPVYSAQDGTGQAHTAVKDAAGHDLDADVINYFVLPGGFWAGQGIAKGDIGVVIHGIQMAFACFGDVGPSGSLGEGSISLHRELGHETIRNRHTASGGTLINSGIGKDVITIVFPGSGNGQGRTNAESATIGEPLFQRLKLQASAYRQQGEQFAQKMRQHFIPRILR
jgi:hypothetical protein